MDKRYRTSNQKFLFAILIVAVALVSSGVTAILCTFFSTTGKWNSFFQLKNTIEGTYFYYNENGITEERLLDAGLRGMISEIGDDYAQYFSEKEYAEHLESNSGEYSGIGITVIEPNDVGSTIQQVYANSPMEEAGVLAGDIIVSINGTKVANLDLDDMLNLFHVDEMPNTILLKRNDVEFEVVVSKRTIVVPYAEWKVLEGNIGYIRLFGFSGHVVKETEDAVRLLKERDVSGIILDLRDNPGGSLNDVLDIADMFLPKDKLIVTIKSRIAEEVQYKAEKDPIYDGQLILLVNENSASASELLSGALKDHGVATIIGTQTFGKGIVQTYFPIAASKGWVKLTTDAYYTPNDVCIHGIGITPDIIVESESEYDNLPIDSIPFESDVQLQEAIHYMRGN